MVLLGVNIDHVATVREARKTIEPDPVRIAVLAEFGGADGITVHLREDRRHIHDRDVRLLRETIASRLNLEMAAVPEIIDIALDIVPDQVTLVPERREELTTEGGLDVSSSSSHLSAVIERFHEKGISVSLFVDPDEIQVRASAECGADCIELHTGAYAEARGADVHEQLQRLSHAAEIADILNIGLNAGHGLTYYNVIPITRLLHLHELNIGHSIVARALFVGMERAVMDMKSLLSSE